MFAEVRGCLAFMQELEMDELSVGECVQLKTDLVENA